MKRKKLIALLCFFCIAPILVGCNDNKQNQTSTTTELIENSNIINVDSYKVFGLAEKHENELFSGETENIDDLNNVNNKSIENLVDEKYTKNDDYDFIETDRNYLITFDLCEDNTNNSNSKVISNDSNRIFAKSAQENQYGIESISIDGKEADYTVEDGKVNINWKSPSTESQAGIDVEITSNKNGQKNNQKIKIKQDINNKQYNIVIKDTQSFIDKYIMNVNITKNNNGKGGTLHFLVSNDTEIIKDIELNDGQNQIEIDGLIAGHSYGYMIINKHSEHSMNSALYTGNFISLLPYQAIFGDITANSASLTLYNKGSNVNVDYVELYDGDALINKYEANNNYEFNDLTENHDYVVKIHYSYYVNNKKIEDFFKKKFRTLNSDEGFIYMEPSKVNKNSIWSNGTKVFIDSKDDKEKRIYLTKGSIGVDKNGNIEATGNYIKIELPYDSFIYASITSSSTSNVYTRTCTLTNGKDYYRLKVSGYNSNKLPQSYFLKAGTYYIYSNNHGIYIYDLYIRSIMKNTEINEIYNNSQLTEYKIKRNSNTVAVIGGKYDFSNYDIREYYKYSDNSANYLKFPNDIECVLTNEENNQIVIKNGDEVLEEHKNYSIQGFNSDNYLALQAPEKPRFYDANLRYEMIYFEGIEEHQVIQVIFNRMQFYRNAEIKFTDEKFSINCYSDETAYFYKSVVIDDNPDEITYSITQNGRQFESIYNIDTNQVGEGVITVVYKDSYIGEVSLTMPFYVSDIVLPDYLNEQIDKTEYIGDSDLPNNHIKLNVIYKSNGYEEYKTLSLNELEDLYKNNLAGVPSIRCMYDDINGITSDFSSISAGVHKIYLEWNGELIPTSLSITKISSRNITPYDGVKAYEHMQTNDYNDWDIVGEPNSIRANLKEGGECAPDGGGTVVRSYDSSCSITSKEFAKATSATIVILAGTNSSAKDIYITVELLDEEGNVVASKRKFAGTNKITYRSVFEFTTEKEFVKIRVCNFENVKQKVGIVSIDASVA